MRYQSPKQAAIYRKWSPIRRAWLDGYRQCFVCGYTAMEVHEIFNGPLRMKAFVEPAAWLAVCCDCNQNRLTDKMEFPIEKQLGLKLYHDPEHFDLAKCREIIDPRQIDVELIIVAYIQERLS